MILFTHTYLPRSQLPNLKRQVEFKSFHFVPTEYSQPSFLFFFAHPEALPKPLLFSYCTYTHTHTIISSAAAKACLYRLSCPRSSSRGTLPGVGKISSGLSCANFLFQTEKCSSPTTSPMGASELATTPAGSATIPRFPLCGSSILLVQPLSRIIL